MMGKNKWSEHGIDNHPNPCPFFFDRFGRGRSAQAPRFYREAKPLLMHFSPPFLLPARNGG
jgi:hypothetical protein